MGEAEPLELREGLEEVLGEHVVGLGPLLEGRVDPAAVVVDRVVPAPQDPVVAGEPVVVELVAAVADALRGPASRSRPAAPADSGSVISA